MDDQQGELEPLDPQFKYMACKHCGKPMKVSMRRRKSPSHIDCSMQVMIENQRQIAAKEGPMYERWRNGQMRYLEELRGGGPPSDAGG
jgi:hypothetical protein